MSNRKKLEKKKKQTSPINNQENVQHAENNEDSISALTKTLNDAEQLYDSIKDDIQCVERMESWYQRALGTGLFESFELSSHKESIDFHKQRLAKCITAIITKINNAKDLWEKRDEFLHQMYEDNAMDKTLLETTKNTQENFQQRIEKLDAKIEFLYAKEK